MTDPNSHLRTLLQSIDRAAARLNPGLGAVALALATLTLAEASARLPVLYEQSIAAQGIQLASDPTILSPANIPSFDPSLPY